MAEEYVNFENALKELKLSAEQLKRLVSEGEIRAIRGENNSMRFRREEIERLKQDTGKTIQYTEESSDTLTDDLLFDEASDLEVDEEGMATAQISSEDTFVGDDTGMTTAPIKGQKAPPPAKGKPAPAPKAKGEAPAAKPARTTGTVRGATKSTRATTTRSSRIREGDVEVKASGIGVGMVAVLVVTFLISAYSLMLWWDTANNHVSGATAGLVGWSYDTFGKAK